MEAERVPLNSAQERRNDVAVKRDGFSKLNDMLSQLRSKADAMKMPSGFTKMKFESSHPEILNGIADANAVAGEFEVEVTSLARPARELAFGFPDASATPVGFGYMRVGLSDKSVDVVIDPGATLKDVANSINETVGGVRATVINTGAKVDPYRLLVSSMDSGESVHLEIDPDTTFLEMKNQVKSQDFKMKFEGVDITRAGNSFGDLIEGVSLKALKSDPGTKISVKVGHDIDQTSEGIKHFVNAFNEIQTYARQQNIVDPSTGRAGQFSGDSSVRQMSSTLQRSVGEQNLGAIGITTNPKTGELKLDESKLKNALSIDYQAVADIFTSSEKGPGLSQKMSDAIKMLQDKASGAIGSRIKGLDERIRRQDDDIQRKQERMEQRKSQLQRTFASLDAKVATMNQQSLLLGARLNQPTQMQQSAPKNPAVDQTTEHSKN
jgi:flagellar hook-associated protein 2